MLAHTHRLRLRFIEATDFDFLFALQSDPVTMRYIRPADDDPAVVRDRLQLYLTYHQANPHLGVVMAERQDTGEAIGYAVVRHADFLPGADIEIGYGIAPAHWGKGYATEIAQALLEYAFAQFPVEFVVAFTDPANAVSQRVLERCGFESSTRSPKTVRWVRWREKTNG